MPPLHMCSAQARMHARSHACMQADNATVLRDGQLLVVPTADLVPGDIIEVVGGWPACRRRPGELQPGPARAPAEHNFN